MADNDFRAYRSRDAVTRDDIDAHAPDSVRDPLAELARLIGQSDHAGDYERSSTHEHAVQYDNVPVTPGQDWAADHGYQDPQYAEQGYEQPAEPHPALRDYPGYQDTSERHQYDDRYAEPAGYDQAPRRETAYGDRYADDELPPLPRGRQLPALAPEQHYPEQHYEDEYQDEHGNYAYAADVHGGPYTDEYPEQAERKPRRSGLALLVGVVGLVTIGAASALAYRTMFGSALIPSLPPIIKASDGPNKIVPAQAANASGTTASTGNSAEKLVPREEQPVPIQPQNAPPRVVSTIPVSPQQGSAVMGAQPTGPAIQPAPAQSVFPPPPGAAPSFGAAPPPAPAPAQTANPSEPKKIHTVMIKPEQPGSAAQAAATHSSAPTSLSPHAAPAPHTAPPPAPSSPNAPLALVPNAQGGTPPHAATPRTQVARAEPGTGAPLSTSSGAAPAAPSAGGAYSVQVTSQRSEAEAQTAFRELQSKYPAQLGSRHASIHRADLGEKGTYYRALVGPFSSAEGAAGMCSSLKAAGGSCIVQKN